MSFRDSEKIQFTWMSDSWGRLSVHKNVPGLRADDSYLGHIVWERSEILDDQEYFYVMSGSDEKHGPFDSMGEATKAITKRLSEHF